MRYSLNLFTRTINKLSAWNKKLSRQAQVLTPALTTLAILAVVSVVFLYARRITADTGSGSISLTTLGAASTENFDTLVNTAGSTTNTTLPTGWYITETGGGARDNEQYAVDTGASTTGDIYSYGAAASTDRALGALRSGTLIPLFGAKFTNNTGSTITSLNVAYTGEEWRLGALARTDQINFEISTNATDLSTGTYTGVAALNFVTPDIGGVAGAKNGNAAADRTALSTTISSLSIPNGASFFIRWTDADPSGADDGLAVDDFSITPMGSVAQPNLTINDVSLNEGNAGTTSFTFTVSLSAPAGPGGVTFDIATADGTAQDDIPATEDNDYVAKSLTGQTIPAGSSTFSFTVLVNGDTTPETNETFFVNVTNVTGATVTDGQGQGTIVNDDAAPNLTINDVSLSEGNAGTTTFTFTVSLSAPAGAGGVTFDIATADGTAQDDNPATEDNDYVAKSLTSQTIPAGSSTYTFNVLVNGDTAPELDETFFVNVTNITNAIGTDTQGQGTIVNDDITKIHDVQGNGAATPIPGATVTVEGVVVANFQGTNKLQGFFLEEEDTDFDADPATSEGIFIFCSTCPTPVAEGQRVKATGVVSEFNNMTEITASTAGSVVITNAGNNLAQVTPSTIDLPIVGVVDDFYEAREGMKVTFVDSLTVSEYFELGRYGQIILYEGGRPRQFTEANAPSVAGNAAQADNLSRRRVILDDDNNAQEAYLTTSTPPGPADGLQFVYYPRANGGLSVGTQGTDFFRGGDLVNGLTGVLHWSFAGQTGTDAWRIRPTTANPATFTVANPRPATPPAVGGAIKVAGMNLLNYFTTIDTTSSTSTGPCGPSGTLDCRGADSVAELNRQRERASIVICTLNADIYGFAELENTTPSASITDLLGAVNARCGGAHPYAFVNTGGTLGTDAIRVQQIYRTGIVSPVGAPLSDLDPVHNRPPTAQTYDVVDATNTAFGQRFTVVINHFKSKGCPGTGGDADSGDGQGCFNATRVAQANRLLTWINSTVLPAAGDPDVLLLGDFNAYAKEDPITALLGGGFNDLETLFHGANAYSYLFDGQLGHLDYGFASMALLSQITGADAWHINADECDLFDYNDEIRDNPGESTFEEKPDGSALVPPRVVFQPGTPYRASDHDPVLIGLFSCTLTCPSNITVAAASGQCSATVTFSPTTSGSCTITCSPASGSTFNVGTTTVTCSQSSGIPNCSFTVTVTDNQVPVLGTCPANITNQAAGANCMATVIFTNPTATDNCGTPTVTCTPASGSSFPLGTTTVSCKATDAANNMSAPCTFTVQVVDTTAPTLGACPANITNQTAGANCMATVTFTNPTATDNCGTPTVTCTPASGSSFPLGTTTVSCKATDAANNMSAPCTFTVQVVDTTAPTLGACPANITMPNTTNQCSAVVTFTNPSATDNCGTPTVTCTPASGSSFAVGTTTVSCKATDASNNMSAPCTFTVTVQDTQAPTIGACPANISVNGSSPTVVTYTAPTATDNCPGATVTCVPASGSSFAVGTTTVTCTAADASPNSPNTTCTFTVTVVPCTITCPANVVAWTAGTSAPVTYSAPTTTGSCGTVTCTPASGSTFNVGTTTVTCSAAAGPSCSFTVTVNRLTLGAALADPLACSGPGNKVNGSFSATNTTGAAANVSVSATLSNLAYLPATATATQPGAIVVLSNVVSWTGTLGAGQTVTVSYMAQIADNAPPNTQACSVTTATVNGLPVFGSASACLTVTCPTPGPGGIFPTASEASDQKAGSVLVYNIYTSGATSGNTQNTRINITNVHPLLSSFVHLFFVAEGCSIADSYICLTGNQTTSFLASDLDPGTTGYIVAVAVNSIGCPTSFNYLIGDEYVKFSSGHAANLGAEAFAQLAGGLPACDGNSVTATLNFDGVSYNRVPAVLALDSVGARADGNDTLLIVNRIGGNLGIGASTLSTLFGILYDDAESSLSFSVSGNCQLRNSLSNNFPRTTPRFESFIPAGRTGWLKIFNQTAAIGITGSAINFNPNAGASAGAFNQGHNLHHLTLTTSSYVIPIFPPSC